MKRNHSLKTLLSPMVILISISIFLITGCAQEEAGTVEKSNTYAGSEYETYFINTTSATTVEYSLDLGSYTKDVYFVLTNTSPSSSDTAPTVSSNSIDGEEVYEEPLIYMPESVVSLPENNTAARGTPEIAEFNKNSPADFEVAPYSSKNIMPGPVEPRYDTVSDTYTFDVDSNVGTVAATCRKVVSGITTDMGTKTLNIWVADDCWTGAAAGKTYYVTSTMVDALADKFLITTTDNDIYDWVTSVVGEEWGTHVYSNLITANDEITILLYDIDGTATIGGTVGYFYSLHNFLTSSYPTSNERIMFFLDAVMFANDDEGGSGTWATTDTWPEEVISTLAHEFQHMIHYYQKTVKNTLSSGSETWLDEMCAMITEDYVSKKLAIKGPRGVIGTNLDVGSSSNTDGRLYYFNQYNDRSLTDWYSGSTLSEVLKDYSASYSFGAWLARNFSGIALLQNMVQNSNTDYQAVTTALASVGNGDDFGTLLRRWAIAQLLSDKTNTSSPYELNNGSTGFPDSDTGRALDLGSINMFYYSPTPTIYTSSNLPSTSIEKAANRIVKAGDDVTGSNEWSITLGANTQLTVMVRDDI
ncbi:MAG: hypothetical protein GY754_25825 [bacterium]|nr:hypothetical protein [bacterium]